MPSADETETSTQRAGTRSPHTWVPSTYFAEGFPYAVVNNIAEIVFQQAGASLGLVGLTSLLHAPWNVKFLWAPWVDSVGTKRRWMIAAQLVGAVLLFCMAAVPVHAGALPWLGALFFALAVTSATNDIAIDAYYMEALGDAEQAKFVGYRATAYKVATLLVKGPLQGLLGVAGFAFGFATMGAVLLLVALAHIWLLAETGAVRATSQLATSQLATDVGGGARTKVPSRRWIWTLGLVAVVLVLAVGPLNGSLHWLIAGKIPLSFWVAIALLLALAAAWAWGVRLKQAGRDRPAFAALMATPRIGVALAFVIFFRTGESFLQKMKWPFLNQSIGVSVAEYAVVNGTVGVVAGFVGTFAGGFLIARSGLRRWFWWFILAQNVPNLAYVGLAAVAPHSAEALGGFHPLVLSVVCVEELGSGFGTAVLMVYLMRLCVREHRATHFAVLTALMSLSFTFAGAGSGFIAEALGFAPYFAFTFLATFPMMLLGWFTPGVDDPAAASSRPAGS